MESSAHGPVLVAAPVLQGASAETFQGGNAGEYNDISVGLVFYWLNVTEQLGPGSDQWINYNYFFQTWSDKRKITGQKKKK